MSNATYKLCDIQCLEPTVSAEKESELSKEI